jgi:hypothetical protein
MQAAGLPSEVQRFIPERASVHNRPVLAVVTKVGKHVAALGRTGATCCGPYAEAHTKLRNLLRSLVFYREPEHKTALFNCTRQAVCRKVERRGKGSTSRVEGTQHAQAMNAGVTQEKDFR